MKQKLPPPQVTVTALFPKNIRFITEYTFSDVQSRNIKITLVSVISLFLISLISLEGVSIWSNIRQQQSITSQTTRLQNEVAYWKGIANKYRGYRDVYYRIGALQYKLGNVQEAQKYVKKAIQLDPNYPEGRVLGAHVGL